MRIERIELENWMSYPRRWTPPGQPEDAVQVVPTIDLSGQPLVLISGDNGAGKSAILEAICYALFAKYPRGKNENAIRSGETSATVRLHFTLPTAKGEATYCVERKLSRKAGGTNALLTQRQANGSAVTLQSGQQPVTEYIVNELLSGVDYDAFASSVFLRQEEAGRFMEASHAAQREQLLRLCRLEVYERIFDCAQRHRKVLVSATQEFQAEFDQIKHVTETYLSGKRNEAGQLEDQRNRLRREEETARQALDKVKRAVALGTEIQGGRQKIEKWGTLLQNADAIRHASLWTTVWERVHHPLMQGSELFASISRRESEIKQAQQDFTAAQREAAARKQDHDGLTAEQKELQESLSKLSNDLVALTDKRNSAERTLTVARKAHELDCKVSRVQAEQEARAAELVAYDQVKLRRGYASLLTRAQSTLRLVLQGLDDAGADVKTAEDSETEASEAEREAAEIDAALKGKRDLLEKLECEVADIHSQQGELRRLQDSSQVIIDNRNKAVAAGVCPTCGTEIKGSIEKHVCQEIEDHERRLATAGLKLETLNADIERKEGQIKQVQNEINGSDRRRVQLESQVTQTKAEAKRARQSAAKRTQVAENEWQRHLGEWQEAPVPDWLTAPSAEARQRIESELQLLSDAEPQFHHLTEIRAAFQSQDEILAEYTHERAKLVITSPILESQIAELDSAHRDLEQQVQEAEAKRKEVQSSTKKADARLETAKRQLEAAEKKRSASEMNLVGLRTSQDNERQLFERTMSGLKAEQRKIAPKFPDLSAGLLNAVEGAAALDALSALASDYGKEADQLAELEQAERESAKAKTEIELKQRDLDALIAEVGAITEGDATVRWQDLQARLTSAEQEFTEINREIGGLERDFQRRQELELHLKDSKKQLWAFKTIEDAIDPGTKTRAPGELYGLITKRLMEMIGMEASRTLTDLGWDIGIAYDDRRGFSIQDRALSATRAYQEFSGGERFAIAIAVALAIGRATHGAGNIRCLFVDEGFGALDQKHRRRIIDDAIGRLIEIGNRDQVVVISHLDDMQAYFPNRIELKRDRNQSALGLRSEDML